MYPSEDPWHNEYALFGWLVVFERRFLEGTVVYCLNLEGGEV
jgi:uncharacterized membrane protein